MRIDKQRVYRLLEKIPEGKVTTYKILASAIDTKAYRAIGQILKKNPHAPRIPCHRVVKSDGTLGGYMGKNSIDSLNRKRKLLSREGISFDGNKVRAFPSRLFHF